MGESQILSAVVAAHLLVGRSGTSTF